MARRFIIMTLLATALLPCRAQESQGKSIPELLVELKKPQKEADKAKLLLDLALAYVYKPGEYAKDLDTAVLLTKEVERINQRLNDKKIQAKSYFVYSNALREAGKIEGGRNYIEKSLTLYGAINEPSAMAEAWLELSRYYLSYDDESIKNRKQCFEQALPLFQAAGNKEMQADILKNLGDFDYLQSNFVQAIKELKEARSIYLSIGYKKLQGVYDLLGVVSSYMGDYPGAVKYGLLAIKAAEEDADTSIQLCTIYNRLGMSYSNWSKREQAVIYLKKAMAIAIKYNDMVAMKTVLMNLCQQLDMLKKWDESLIVTRSADSAIRHSNRPLSASDTAVLAICYNYTWLARKQYDKAGSYAGEMIALAKRYPDEGQNVLPTIYMYMSLIRYYMAVRLYADAGKYTDTLLSFSIIYNDKRYIAKAYKLKSEVDSARGDYKSALSDFHAYKAITDSMLNETASFQFAEQQVEYETEKKDNDIKLLKQQEEIQKTKLIQSRTTNSIVIASIIVLFLLLTLLYNQYRIKQRSTKELETKQQQINEKNITLEHLINDKDHLIADKDVLLKEKDWLVKEIHHRVKNNLQMVISLLNAQSEFLNNPSALDAIRESRERMQAIAILHQKLYQAEDNTKINMRAYLHELIENIRLSFDKSERIHFQVDVADIGLDMSHSVPLGLILNEAITNAIKYAYPKNTKGIIQISLLRIEGQQLQLIVSDRGKGLPEGFCIEHNHSLGMQLIKLFAEQLEGDLFFLNKNGLKIVLNFKLSEFSQTSMGTVTSISM